MTRSRICCLFACLMLPLCSGSQTAVTPRTDYAAQTDAYLGKIARQELVDRRAQMANIRDANGIQMNAVNTSITNVNILDCMICYNYWDGIATQNSGTGVVDTETLYGNAFFQNGYYGIQLGGTTTHYTVGGPGSNGTYSNSFADNQIEYHPINYPNPTQTNTYGYVSGTDVNLSANSQLASSNNLVQWNSYFTP